MICKIDNLKQKKLGIKLQVKLAYTPGKNTYCHSLTLFKERS